MVRVDVGVVGLTEEKLEDTGLGVGGEEGEGILESVECKDEESVVGECEVNARDVVLWINGRVEGA